MRKNEPVKPDQLFEGSVCWYDFASPIRGELSGPRPVVILSKNPGLRMQRHLDIQVIPLSTAPPYQGQKTIKVNFAGVTGNALPSQITTVNPLRLRSYSGRLTTKEFEAVKRGIAERFEDVDPNPQGRAAHLRPGHVLLVQTDRAPDGRRYVILDNRRTHIHVDNLQMLPLTGNANETESCRIRSFGNDRVAHLRPIAKVSEQNLALLRDVLRQRLNLPGQGVSALNGAL